MAVAPYNTGKVKIGLAQNRPRQVPSDQNWLLDVLLPEQKLPLLQRMVQFITKKGNCHG